MTNEQILALIRKKGQLRSQDLVKAYGISRQVAADRLKKLVETGQIVKFGATNKASYSLNSKKLKSPPPHLSFVKKIQGLKEDRVFDEVDRRLPLKKSLNKPTASTLHYAFSEMLNNAIDHSKSTWVSINVKLENGLVSFLIKDGGIGAFYNVRKTFALKDEYQGAEHLFKGKQTTDPENHSGQGIFFTSRIADVFWIRSHRLKALIDNENEDVFFSDEKNIKGTEVFFSIKQKSKKSLEKLFRDFANSDYEFDKNEVRLRLRNANEAISRSQARRLTIGLEKFQRLVFDFEGIKSIGQGFADEIFRVYASRNPKVLLSYKNASPAVEFMLQRAIKAG